MTRAALLLVGACSHPQAARIEHHAAPATDETFVLDAPLFSSDPNEHVVWTLVRHGTTATFTLGDEPPAVGTFDEHGDAIHVEVATADGPTTLDCHRAAAEVHAAGAAPQERGDHPVCSIPRTWQPAATLRIPVLACTVHREQLVTQVTLAAPPGLQAVVDDCCDDDDRCERRWEIRRR